MAVISRKPANMSASARHQPVWDAAGRTVSYDSNKTVAAHNGLDILRNAARDRFFRFASSAAPHPGQLPREELPTLRPQQPTPMTDILEVLKAGRFDPMAESLDFPVEGKITCRHLQALLDLPFEVLMFGTFDGLFLTSGMDRTTGPPVMGPLMTRWKSTHTSFHAHIDRVEGAPSNAPSIDDLLSLCGMYGIGLLGHAAGITLYSLPVFHPLTGKRLKSVLRGDGFEFELLEDLMNEFFRHHGIAAYFTGVPDPDRPKFHDLSPRQRVELMRAFAVSSGIIVTESTWDDSRGLGTFTRWLNRHRPMSRSTIDTLRKKANIAASTFSLGVA